MNETNPPEIPKKQSIFKKKEETLPPLDPGLTKNISFLSSRVRVLEQRLSELNKKILFVEQNMLLNHKTTMNNIRSLQDDTNAVKASFQDTNEKILAIIKELKLKAGKEDVGVVKKYVELWNLVKFVTQEQVEKIIDEKIEEKKKIENPLRQKQENNTKKNNIKEKTEDSTETDEN